MGGQPFTVALKLRMATRYDYGIFSKAAPRLLKPAAEALQFRLLKGCAFGRERANWVDGLVLQQSAHGSGDFCVNIGIHIPALDDLWMTAPDERSFGLSIWGRLGQDGVSSGDWYSAANKTELEASIQQIESYLQLADAWFRKFKSLSDIAKEYKTRSDLTHINEDEHLSTIAFVNYGFLLLLADNLGEARKWLEIARAQCQFVVMQNVLNFKKRKPGKEALYYHELDLKRLKAVEAALNE